MSLKKLSPQIKKAFDLYDDDKNGVLDPYELQILLDDIVKELKIPKLNHKQLYWSLNILSKNQSGFVTYGQLQDSIEIIMDKFIDDHDEYNGVVFVSDNILTKLQSTNFIRKLGTKILCLERITQRKESKLQFLRSKSLDLENLNNNSFSYRIFVE